MHSNQKIKKSRVLFKTSIILVFILSIFGIALYLYIETKSRLDIGLGISESLDKVSIEIAGHHFLIPKAYILSRKSWRGGKMTGVNMRALLPDFKPYSKEVKAEFNKSGSENIVNILLSSKESKYDDLFENYLSYIINKEGEEYLEDLVKYEFDSELIVNNVNLAQYHKKDELFLGVVAGNKKIIMECRKEKKVSFPRCHAVINFSDKIIIKYSFLRMHLKNWRTIYINLHKLIRSFKVELSNTSQKGE